MKCMEYSVIDFIRILGNNGYVINRYSGGHAIYVHKNNHISIPTGKKTLNKMLTLRLIKENNLKVS